MRGSVRQRDDGLAVRGEGDVANADGGAWTRVSDQGRDLDVVEQRLRRHPGQVPHEDPAVGGHTGHKVLLGLQPEGGVCTLYIYGNFITLNKRKLH